MLDREALTGFLRIGFFVGGCGLIMTFVQPPGSAEFVLSLCSAAIGGALVLGAAAFVRLRRRKG